ncbi:MAG: (2Fe-2S)-binding protein [Alphaproteobacteria bacterium]
MFSITINGRHHDVTVAPDTPLLWVLRDALGLSGTKFGCGIGQCGSCTVHVDGSPVRSCVTPVAAVAGQAVVTIEGLAEGLGGPVGEAVRQAWRTIDVPQCGYCQSGQIMAATALLRRTPLPSDDDIDTAMSGNLCRCGTYNRVRAAIHTAAASLKKGA